MSALLGYLKRNSFRVTPHQPGRVHAEQEAFVGRDGRDEQFGDEFLRVDWPDRGRSGADVPRWTSQGVGGDLSVAGSWQRGGIIVAGWALTYRGNE
jgi:hypothetical protein